MSIYGEGQYRNPEPSEADRPGLRAEAQLAARSGSARDDGDAARAGADRRDEAARPTRSTPSTSATTRRCSSRRRGYGSPGRARFFNVYGERPALSNPYTGVAAIFASRLLNDRPPVVFEDGDADAGLHRRRGPRAALRARALAGTAPTARRSTSARAGDVDPRGRATIARGLGKRSSRRSSSEYRAGDIRHCYADTRLAEDLLGFRSEIAFESGMSDLLAWLEGQEAVDAVDAGARGARRARPGPLAA
jgi:dTDP-L-rhamnose 4-epimerase